MIASSTTSSMLSTPRTSVAVSPPTQSPARGFPASPSWADDDDEFFDSCQSTPAPSPPSFASATKAPAAKAPQWQVMTGAESKPPAQQHFGSGRVAPQQKPKATGWGMPNTVAPGAAGGSRFDSLQPNAGLNTWRRR